MSHLRLLALLVVCLGVVAAHTDPEEDVKEYDVDDNLNYTQPRTYPCMEDWARTVSRGTRNINIKPKKSKSKAVS